MYTSFLHVFALSVLLFFVLLLVFRLVSRSDRLQRLGSLGRVMLGFSLT